MASQQWRDHRYVLTDDFVLMIVFGELWASSHTGQAAWQRAEHSSRAADNKPIDSTSRWSWATGRTENLKCSIHGFQKRPQDRSITARCVWSSSFCPRTNSSWEEKEGGGERGRTAASQTERKLFTMKAKMWRKRPFYLIPSCSCLVAQQVKDVCVGCFPSPAVVRWCPAGAAIEAE